MFIDVTGGRNGDPRSKIDFFGSLIREYPRLALDLALMKLCYVDFNPRTDVNGLFGYYRMTLDALRRDHTEIRFAHVTVPLVVRPTAPKWRIFRLVGREVWEDAANAKRTEFNSRLGETFGPDAVFDLARIEATAPDGRLTTFQLAGRSYPSLYPGYAADEGHLNEAGQRVAGAAVLDFLGRALSAASAQG